ncbi:hypothetical protein [Polystyrenella longa]|nr:hypothetical protein [Polystyrenella longa]
MSHLKTRTLCFSTLIATLILFVDAPQSVFAQEDSGNFFEGFAKPLRNLTADGGSEDIADSKTEQAPPPAVEELALDLLVSGQTHPSQQIDTELTNAEAIKDFARNRSQLGDILEEGKIDSDSMEVIRKSLEQLLYSLTVKEHQKSEESNKIYDLLYRYFVKKSGEDLPPIQRQRYREQVFSQMLPLMEEMLKQNYFVRLRIAILLSDLDLKIGDYRNNISPVPFRAAVDLALKTVASEDQPEAVKICCLRSLHKGLQYGDFSKVYRLQIVAVCIDQLLGKADNWWYQRELVKCLEVSDVDIDENGVPVVVHALAVVLSDPTRNKMVRSQAAHALGRVPISSGMRINFELLSYELLSFTISMAEERDDMISSYEGSQVPAAFMSHWGLCFGNVYLAYQPLDQQEKTNEVGLLQRTTRPGMNDHATQIKETYSRIHPFFSFLLNKNNFNTKFPEAMVTSGKKWLEEYPPSDFKVAPNTEALVNLNQKSQPEAAQTASR